MLDTLRESSKSIITYLIVGGLCFAMAAIFGPGSCTNMTSSSSPFAAKVNGSVITVAAFEQEYSNEFHSYQQRAGGGFNSELAEQLHLRDRVMDNLIDTELLSQEAERLGIYVGDEELADRVRKDFSKDGAFDPAWYKQVVLQYYQMSPIAFEKQLRKKMVVAKVVASITAAAQVSDDEVKADFVRDNEKADLEYVRFAPAQFNKEVPAPSADEAKEWAAKNADKVKEFFAKNTFRYNKPGKAAARQILVKVESDASSEKVEVARKKADAAKAELDSGKDFADVAKRASEDAATKDRGGDLGEVSPGVKGKDFDEALGSLSEGQVSAVFRDPMGFHIVKLEKRIAPVNKTLPEVEGEIAKELMVQEKAEALARMAADETLDKLRKGEKLAEIWPSEKKAKDSPSEFQFDLGSKKPEVDDTGDFGLQGDFVPHIGVAADIQSAAFAVDENKQRWLNQVFRVNNAFYVLAVKSRTRADLAQLSGKLDELREKARKHRGEALVEAYLKNLKDTYQASIQKNTALTGPQAKGLPGQDEG